MKGLQRWRRFLVLASLFFGFFFLLGFFSKYHWPRIKSWVLVEIESYSHEHLPLRIWAKDLSLGAFPPRLIFRDIDLLPQDELAHTLAPSTVKEVELSLSLWGLLTGQLRISSLRLASPSIFIVVPEDEGMPDKEPRSISLQEIFQLPIDRLQVEDGQVMAYLRQRSLALQGKNLNLTVDNRLRALAVHLEAPQLTLLQVDSPLYARLSLETRLMINENELRVSAAKIQREKSYVVGFGRGQVNWDDLKWGDYEFRVRNSIDLEEMRHWMDLVQYDPLPPAMSGLVQMDLDVNSTDQSWPNIQFEITTQDVLFDHFEIGQVTSKGTLRDSEVQSTRTRIQNSAGQVSVSDLELNWESKVLVSGEVDVESLELRQLLLSLGLGDTPLYLPMKGQAPCAGELHPNLQLKCAGEITATEFSLKQEVAPDGTRGKIIHLEQIAAQGEVEINNKSVKYSAKAQLGENSLGSSSGEVIYDTGFKVSFEGERLDFSDVTELAGLGLEGQAKVKGTAEGDSRTATTRMSIEGDGFWLDDYALGSLSMDLRYARGSLSFRNIQGLFQTSRYSGHMTLNLREQQLFIDAQSPYLDLEDLRQVFRRHFLLPFEIQGTGSASLRAWGPLNFGQLNYELNSTFYRGLLAGEGFDELLVNLVATQGRARSERVQVVRGNSAVTVEGSIHPLKDMELDIRGRNLRLEEFESVSRLGLNLLGQMDFTSQLSGPVQDPEVTFKGDFSRLTIADQAVDDSQIEFKLSPQGVDGRAQLLGETIETEFLLPFDDKLPFRLQLETVNWDFTHLFSMLGPSDERSDFQTRLTGKVNLFAPQGGFWNSTGNISIDEFELRRGPSQIRAPRPLSIRLSEGQIQAFNYNLDGPESVLNISVENSNRSNIRANVNGRVELGLLAFLTPFLGDLRGDLSLSVSSSGPIDDIQLLGSAYVENGVLRLNEFPHPFENLRADLLFSQKNILINALRAQLAGGQVHGDGRVEIKGLTHVPIEINGRLSNVNLHFPENIRTRGSGQLAVRGDWFPYTLDITYNVVSGEFTQELAGTAGAPTTRPVSPHLPEFLVQDRFEPIVLDLKIQLVNPIRVRNSLVDSLIAGELTIQGPPENPLLTGSLSPVAGGQLTFRDNSFDIITGFINYQNSPPENPQIYVTAQARITEAIQITDAQRPQEYEIQLLVQGRAPDLEIRLTSQPALTESEIVSLLALGLISPEGLEQGALGQPSVQIGSAILQRPISRELRDRLGVDLQVSTTFVDNVSVPKVIVNKQWTPRWGSSASRTIEKTPTNNVKLEFKVNRNLSLVGSWEGREEAASLQQERSTAPNRLGLDLEYTVEFR